MDWAPTEFQILGYAVLLGVFQLFWAAFEARRQQGLKWASGPRDEHRPITGTAARLDRAFRNFMETFPLFAVAVIAAYWAQKTGPLTQWGALVYLVARVLYVPIYAAGIPGIRSFVWFASIFGILAVVLALFLPEISGLTVSAYDPGAQ